MREATKECKLEISERTLRSRPSVNAQLEWLLLAYVLSAPLMVKKQRLIHCPFRMITGLSCPLCGLTRGIDMTLRGHLLSATKFHVLALPLVAGATAMAVRDGMALYRERGANGYNRESS